MADHSTGVADGDDVGGYWFRDYTSGSDYGVFSDGYSRQDCGSAADPDVVADGDGEAELLEGFAISGVGRVGGGVDLDVGTELNVVADFDTVHVEHDAAVVCVEGFACVDVVAVVAAERRFDESGFVVAAKQRLEDGGTLRELLGRGVVVGMRGLAGCEAVGGKLFVHRVVVFAREHFLLFCRHVWDRR